MQKPIVESPARITEENKAMYIANCRICFLSETMKDCPHCQFRIGLEYKKTDSKLIPVFA
jgi:hypothetical protein